MRLYLSSFRVGNRPEELLRLLGSSGRRTALILNADDYKIAPDREASLQRELRELLGLGLEPEELDLRRYFGRQNELRDVFAGYDLIYVRGGNTFLLRRALRQSGADAIITDLLAADAIVYGGYSAGICVLGPTLHGLEGAEDDPEFITDGYEPPAIWEGLGLVSHAFVPHYQEGYHLAAYYDEQNIPYVALRDGEALVINGDEQRVVG